MKHENTVYKYQDDLCVTLKITRWYLSARRVKFTQIPNFWKPPNGANPQLAKAQR